MKLNTTLENIKDDISLLSFRILDKKSLSTLDRKILSSLKKNIEIILTKKGKLC